MSTWLTEMEYRRSGAKQLGLALNRAFFQEIKEDHGQFRQLMDATTAYWAQSNPALGRAAVEDLIRLRDALESYFALEEFFGFLPTKQSIRSEIIQMASRVQGQHRELFLELSQIIETLEKHLYHEQRTTAPRVARLIQDFYLHWCQHEQEEMDLLQQSHNEELGGSG